ncbi:hypothetical protein Q4574_01465 [Aliiglaciecola sp. 3_MG-2023]|uniref:hypothetical protein n=1 Tax=Aliiglaciecola sp. 3_MG-2023 TaxID=3062644 RepID=UPI0026E36702|nr:hypothetical protein [Aliiglaciecola sp. 3_MG-2023]MDO6691927.1 hypothetical protein [Aliiglaciecola sp. 3_MG-2023]
MSKIIIGTHHKSGTNFFLKVLTTLHKKEKIKLWDRNANPESRKKPKDWNVSSDHQMREIKSALDFCEIEDHIKPYWLEACKENCLWNLKVLPKHSTTGVSSDWEEHFTDKVLAEYRKLFGNPEEQLGYEPII